MSPEPGSAAAVAAVVAVAVVAAVVVVDAVAAAGAAATPLIVTVMFCPVCSTPPPRSRSCSSSDSIVDTTCALDRCWPKKTSRTSSGSCSPVAASRHGGYAATPGPAGANSEEWMSSARVSRHTAKACASTAAYTPAASAAVRDPAPGTCRRRRRRASLRVVTLNDSLGPRAPTPPHLAQSAGQFCARAGPTSSLAHKAAAYSAHSSGSATPRHRAVGAGAGAAGPAGVAAAPVAVVVVVDAVVVVDGHTHTASLACSTAQPPQRFGQTALYSWLEVQAEAPTPQHRGSSAVSTRARAQAASRAQSARRAHVGRAPRRIVAG